MGTAGNRVTFSLSSLRHETIGQLYAMARALQINVASVFRHNLTMYQEILRDEEQRLTKTERTAFTAVVKRISTFHSCRMEGTPDKDAICGTLKSAGAPELCKFVADASITRMALIIDRARVEATGVGGNLGVSIGLDVAAGGNSHDDKLTSSTGTKG